MTTTRPSSKPAGTKHETKVAFVTLFAALVTFGWWALLRDVRIGTPGSQARESRPVEAGIPAPAREAERPEALPDDQREGQRDKPGEAARQRD